MNALDLLLTRSSYNKLVDPAPSGEALDNILSAAHRVPDHANLSPFEFIVCQNDGLTKLADIYHQAAIKSGFDDAAIEKAKILPLRAPMIIIGICKYKHHDMVPRVEQVATTACALHNMQLAAFAQGFNGIWRTGNYSQNQYVNEALGLTELDEVIGFMYLGTPMEDTPIKKAKKQTDTVSYWD
ncbi:NAD(P)H nitroreductase [uncultured Psychrosphaera sp.]|uniref:NAD(P)H nitroreductase n=1 Tax=uncultured Psychrosphaera sp. TaxID=1403522 RepID=UPI0026308F74|nr:NAD(P)H nitroreductase [uncultured Psychrosphaera sp.]